MTFHSKLVCLRKPFSFQSRVWQFCWGPGASRRVHTCTCTYTRHLAETQQQQSTPGTVRKVCLAWDSIYKKRKNGPSPPDQGSDIYPRESLSFLFYFPCRLSYFFKEFITRSGIPLSSLGWKPIPPSSPVTLPYAKENCFKTLSFARWSSFQADEHLLLTFTQGIQCRHADICELLLITKYKNPIIVPFLFIVHQLSG